MKHYLGLFLFLALIFTISCETATEEIEAICLPTNISITLIQGSQSSKIIADFHYIPETELLDHITWSNHQTHYFEYDTQNRMKVLRVKRIDDKVQEERWFEYEGSLVVRANLVIRNLDYTYLEPKDSIFAGYVEYEYSGENIVEEREYEISENGRTVEYIRKATYEYDDQDNLLSRTELDLKEEISSSGTMTYDQSKHPYSALQYYFSGESYVNNMLTRSEDTDFSYTYDLKLNEYKYPETSYEKLGSAYTRIISYSYQCR